MSLPNWPSRKALLRAVTVLAISLAGLFSTVAPAQAAPTRDKELGQVQTITTVGGFCAGSIRVWASANAEWHGRAMLNVQALPWQGLSGSSSGWSSGSAAGSSLAASCSVGVRVAWRNVHTGKTGEWKFQLTAGPSGSMQHAMFQPTGKGRVVTDVTTDQLNIPSHGEFDAE
ncbi:hypothetical protein [Aldersonia kunmingensis]|uniref:hypothetical protein n=1 Tax=Aldersonia kunmingensis TaxID=408066 RepID=UPI0008352820|nr:hypothetical protein [Aldersonia kunmingensis]